MTDRTYTIHFNPANRVRHNPPTPPRRPKKKEPVRLCLTGSLLFLVCDIVVAGSTPVDAYQIKK